jgi:hypothetical protein
MFTFVFILFLALLILSVIGALAFKVISQSVNRKGDLGINLRDVICPYCNEKTILQRPATLQQPIAWGAGVCSNCGCELDKWGNEISTLSGNEKIAKQLEHIKVTPISPFDEFGKTRLEKVFEDDEK